MVLSTMTISILIHTLFDPPNNNNNNNNKPTSRTRSVRQLKTLALFPNTTVFTTLVPPVFICS